MQGKVHVSALSLADWLSSPAPAPYDPSLTIHSAAQHNAHLAFCEGVLVRLLDRLEKHGMTYPHELCGYAAVPPSGFAYVLACSWPVPFVFFDSRFPVFLVLEAGHSSGMNRCCLRHHVDITTGMLLLV